MAKYRYILCGVVEPDEEISGFRLISPSTVTQQYKGSPEINDSGIRVDVTNIDIDKLSCDSYSTTDSKVKVKDLNPKVFIKVNWEWVPDEELTKEWLNGKIQPHEFYEYLQNKKHLRNTMRGYFTDDRFDEYKKYLSDLSDECSKFVKDWAAKHCKKEDFEYMEKHDIVLTQSVREIYLYRKEEWPRFVGRAIAEKIEDEKSMQEILNKYNPIAKIKEAFRGNK